MELGCLTVDRCEQNMSDLNLLTELTLTGKLFHDHCWCRPVEKSDPFDTRFIGSNVQNVQYIATASLFTFCLKQSCHLMAPLPESVP